MIFSEANREDILNNSAISLLHCQIDRCTGTRRKKTSMDIGETEMWLWTCQMSHQHMWFCVALNVKQSKWCIDVVRMRVRSCVHSTVYPPLGTTQILWCRNIVLSSFVFLSQKSTQDDIERKLISSVSFPSKAKTENRAIRLMWATDVIVFNTGAANYTHTHTQNWTYTLVYAPERKKHSIKRCTEREHNSSTI